MQHNREEHHDKNRESITTEQTTPHHTAPTATLTKITPYATAHAEGKMHTTIHSKQ